MGWWVHRPVVLGREIVLRDECFGGGGAMTGKTNGEYCQVEMEEEYCQVEEEYRQVETKRMDVENAI
jgi:hypothetical protein